MSLEKAIEENTKAIRELIVALTPAYVTHQLPERVIDLRPDRGGVGMLTPPPSSEGSKTPAPLLTLSELTPPFQELIKTKGRAVAVAVLAKFGATGLSKVPCDDFPALQKAIAEAQGAA